MTKASRTRFCLIRHGETDWNLERRIQGQLDIPLNRRGREQARQLAAHLTGQAFDVLYVSDLCRTRQTAEPLALALNLETNTTPSLRERHYGGLQGLTYEEMAERLPYDCARLRAREPEYVPSGGESLHHLAARVDDFLCTLAELHCGATLLIVTHGGVLDIAYRIACQQELALKREFTIPNAALNWISHDGNGWHLEQWADIDHLNKPLDEL
jgi:probable phosphoglycerate mutase